MSRDRTVGDTFYIAFTTRAFATGIPTVLAGTPVISAYEDDSLTQIVAGVSIGVDHDSVVGLNMITIIATGGNGFESGKDYNLVITTGTVGGVSVVGEVVGQFSLGLSAAAVDLANGTDGLGAIKTDSAAILVDTGTTLNTLILDIPTVAEFNARTLVAASYFDPAADTVATVTTLTGHTAQTGDSFARIGAPAGASVSADIADIPTVAEFNARTLVAASYFDPAADTVANVTTVATTTTNTDMRGTDNALAALVTGTADSGTTTTMVDAARTEGDTDYWKGDLIVFTSGTISGQTRLITAFTTASDTITFAPATTQAVGTNTYDIISSGNVDLVNTVTTLTGHTAQTGDSFARLGAPAGASVSADILIIDNFVDGIETTLGTAGAGLTDVTLNSASIDLVWDETMAGHVTADTSGLVMNEWQDGGRLDLILDARMAEASIDTTGGAVDLVTTTTTATTSTNLTTNNDKTGYALTTADKQAVADLILPATNTAFPDIEFLFVAASDHVTPVTGATGTAVTRSIDGSSFGSGTGTLAEVANGIYQYDASAADMNGKIITFRFVGTGGTPGAPDDTFVTVVTSK